MLLVEITEHISTCPRCGNRICKCGQEFLYHITPAENIDDILKHGLKPHPPSFREEQDAWPDGGTEPRVYFAKDEKTVQSFKFPGKNVLIRVDKDWLKSLGLKREQYTGDFYVTKKVSPKFLEVVNTNAMFATRGQDAFNTGREDTDRTEEDRPYPVPLPP